MVSKSDAVKKALVFAKDVIDGIVLTKDLDILILSLAINDVYC